MDNLKEIAKLFEKLLKMQYKIVLARKGIEVELLLNFEKEHFFHLSGLHKLKDIEYPFKNKSKIFDAILEDKLTYEMIKKSEFFLPNEKTKYVGIKDRINSISQIEEILDSDNLIFKYNKNHLRWSDIKFKYVFESIGYETPIYIFINEISNNNIVGCVSMFPKVNQDYTKGQTKMTLLYKEKINKITGESIILYKHNNYNPDRQTKDLKEVVINKDDNK